MVSIDGAWKNTSLLLVSASTSLSSHSGLFVYCRAARSDGSYLRDVVNAWRVWTEHSASGAMAAGSSTLYHRTRLHRQRLDWAPAGQVRTTTGSVKHDRHAQPPRVKTCSHAEYGRCPHLIVALTYRKLVTSSVLPQNE